MTESELPAPSDKPSPAGQRSGLLRTLYRDERARWRTHYRPYFKAAARALGLGFVLGFAVFLIWPAQEKKALLFLLKALKDIPLGAPPLILALTLFYHNARAALLAVAAGGIPFLCLPILDPFFNGAALGLLASVSKHQGLNVPILFLRSIVPHGLFELPAVLYAASAGLYLSVTLGKHARAKLRKRRSAPGDGPASAAAPDRGSERSADRGELDGRRARSSASDASFGTATAIKDGDPSGNSRSALTGCFASVARSFLLVVLPLLLIAAFIEAFVTPFFG